MSDLAIHRVKISAKKLRALPDQERHFVILAGHALNELNFIHRCIFATDNEWGQKSDVERNVIWSQTLSFLRLHLSKFHEI